MSLFNTLSIGATGLGASSTALAVLGDNIANVGTTGFKAGRASFADMIPETRGGFIGPSTLGLGSRLQTVMTDFNQGTVKDSSNSLDVAIVGKGFFQVRDAVGGDKYYSRDGAFHVDKDNYIVNAGGLRMQGFQLYDNMITSQVGDVVLDLNPISHQLTETITMDMVLSAEADFTATPYTTVAKDGSNGSGYNMGDLSLMADFSTSVTVYDSLGVGHDVTVFFERTAANDWNWSAVVDGGEVDLSVAPDGTPDGDAGYALEISSGTMIFDTDGVISTFTETATATPWTWPGADTFTFALETGIDSGGNAIDGMVRMTGGPSSVAYIDQDGFRSANLVAIRVENDGRVISSYENGEERTLGQLALAMFPSEDGLQRVGGNLYKETGRSGVPALGKPNEAGRGATSGYTLENSNVELEDQFVAMIQAQRTYQANTSTIRTANETLQQLIGLV